MREADASSNKKFDLLQISENGFEIVDHYTSLLYKWLDVNAIFGFKLDLITTDEVCLDLFFADKTSVRISESMSGWNEFNICLITYFSVIPESWENEIVMPPFETNLKLLYDRENRSFVEVEAACYDQTHGR